MEFFGILSPSTKGIVDNVPQILLDNRAILEGNNFLFRYGEVQRMKLRLEQFTQVLPDIPLAYYQYWQLDGAFWLLLFTKRDILYRDEINDKFVFLTPKYSTGTITVTNGDATVVGSGTDFANLKAGDFITIGTGYDTADTWYEVASITDGTNLELTTVYAGTTEGGKNYQARVTYAGTDRNYWRVTTFNDKIVATNDGANWIQTWNGTNRFTNLNTTFKCKFLYVYENHLLCGYTIEGGVDYPRVIRGSDINDETDFTAAADSDAINTSIKSTYYNITGFSEINGNLVVFSERSIEEWWYVGGEDIYNSKQVVDGVGAWAPNSIVSDGGVIYFYSTDATFRVYNSFSWNSISDSIVKTVKNFHPDYDSDIQGYITEEYNQILWAIPTSASTGRLNKLLTYDLSAAGNSWGFSDIEISCFGSYLTETIYTWDTLPFSTWDTWAWDRWDTRFGLANAPIDLVGSYDKYVYQMFGDNQDKAVDYTGFFVLGSNLSKEGGINVFKWLQEIQLIFRGESSGTLSLHIKRDFETAWQSAGSIALTSENDTVFNQVSSISYQARHFQLKITGANAFRIVGVIFGFINLKSTRG